MVYFLSVGACCNDRSVHCFHGSAVQNNVAKQIVINKVKQNELLRRFSQIEFRGQYSKDILFSYHDIDFHHIA